jgi:hypothetical protein
MARIVESYYDVTGTAFYTLEHDDGTVTSDGLGFDVTEEQVALRLVECDAQTEWTHQSGSITYTCWSVDESAWYHTEHDPEYDAWIDEQWQAIQDYQALADDALETW